jgi:hypothetical protein
VPLNSFTFEQANQTGRSRLQEEVDETNLLLNVSNISMELKQMEQEKPLPEVESSNLLKAQKRQPKNLKQYVNSLQRFTPMAKSQEVL